MTCAIGDRDRTNLFCIVRMKLHCFQKKYSGKIDLETIEADLRRQKLRAIFGRMIFDIAEIFPEAFPDSFDKYPGLII